MAQYEWEVVVTGVTSVNSSNIGLRFSEAKGEYDRLVASYRALHPELVLDEEGSRAEGYYTARFYSPAAYGKLGMGVSQCRYTVNINRYDAEE